MDTLAILAHFDPDGLVAPHVLRHIEALGQVAERLVVVSSADLVDSAAADISERAELVRRHNEGYDFASWQAGLRHVGSWRDAQRVIIANDSVVGPVVPYSTIVQRAVDSGVPWWGITASRERSPHLQSYVLGFERAALVHPALEAFWDSLVLVENRLEAVLQGEIGLSESMAAAGLVGVPFFVPTLEDDKVARGRRARAEYLRRMTTLAVPLTTEASSDEPPVAQPSTRTRAQRAAAGYLLPGAAYNPMNALWDRVLDGRLPFVKLETLRDDPYLLDSYDVMLTELEEAFPHEFEGVRGYLERVRPMFAEVGRGRDPAEHWAAATLTSAHLTGPWGDQPPVHVRNKEGTTPVDGTIVGPDDYGDSYYSHYNGPEYDPAEPHWQQFFGRVSKRVVEILHPETVLDVGCAMGIFVGNLRALGVDAEGVDHSEYAISKADPRAEGHLRVGDITEPLEGRWDLISAIEVLEHLPASQIDQAIANLCSVTDTILFSSSPDDFNEGTHINVRPPSYWAALFASHGFHRRFDIDASFLSYWAVVLQRRPMDVRTVVADYETALWDMRRENVGTREAVIRRDRELAELHAQVARLQAAEKRLAAVEKSTSYRVASGAARRLRWAKRG
jgi:SAM-dependent methyltransferase